MLINNYFCLGATMLLILSCIFIMHGLFLIALLYFITAIGLFFIVLFNSDNKGDKKCK